MLHYPQFHISPAGPGNGRSTIVVVPVV